MVQLLAKELRLTQSSGAKRQPILCDLWKTRYINLYQVVCKHMYLSKVFTTSAGRTILKMKISNWPPFNLSFKMLAEKFISLIVWCFNMIMLIPKNRYIHNEYFKDIMTRTHYDSEAETLMKFYSSYCVNILSGMYRYLHYLRWVILQLHVLMIFRLLVKKFHFDSLDPTIWRSEKFGCK